MNGNRDKLLLVPFGVAVAAGYAAMFWAFFQDSVVGLAGAGFVFAAIVAIAWTLAGTRDQTIGRKLLMIALAPGALLGALLGLVFILLFEIGLIPVLAVRRMRKEAQLRRAMSKQGRLLHMSQLAPRLEAGEGTLLEETGHKGAYRIWWTDDDLTDRAPSIDAGERFLQLLEGSDFGGFNQLCLESYVGQSQGKACLTTIPPRQVNSGNLARRFPKARRVMVVRLEDT